MRPQRTTPTSRGAALLAAVLTTVVFGGCQEDAATTPPDEVNRFETSMGVWDAQGQVFSELSDAQDVDIVMGFQGLVFVNLALMAERDIPARFRAEGEIVFEDVDERYPFFDNQVLFEPVGDDWRVVPSFRVPFVLPVSELDGRVVRLDLRLESVTGDWQAESSRRFTVRDTECRHTPEGEFVCD